MGLFAFYFHFFIHQIISYKSLRMNAFISQTEACSVSVLRSGLNMINCTVKCESEVSCTVAALQSLYYNIVPLTKPMPALLHTRFVQRLYRLCVGGSWRVKYCYSFVPWIRCRCGHMTWEMWWRRIVPFIRYACLLVKYISVAACLELQTCVWCISHDAFQRSFCLQSIVTFWHCSILSARNLWIFYTCAVSIRF